MLYLWVVHHEVDKNDKCGIGLWFTHHSMMPEETVKRTVSTEAGDVVSLKEYNACKLKNGDHLHTVTLQSPWWLAGVLGSRNCHSDDIG